MILVFVILLAIVGATQPGRSEIRFTYTNDCMQNSGGTPDYIHICGPGTFWSDTICLPKISVEQNSTQPTRLKIKEIYIYNNLQCSMTNTLYVCGPGTTWEGRTTLERQCRLDCEQQSCELSIFERLVLGISTALIDNTNKASTQITETIIPNIINIINCSNTNCEISLFEQLIIQIVIIELDTTTPQRKSYIDTMDAINTTKQLVMQIYDCPDEICMNNVLHVIIEIYKAIIETIRGVRRRLSSLISVYLISFSSIAPIGASSIDFDITSLVMGHVATSSLPDAAQPASSLPDAAQPVGVSSLVSIINTISTGIFETIKLTTIETMMGTTGAVPMPVMVVPMWTAMAMDVGKIVGAAVGDITAGADDNTVAADADGITDIITHAVYEAISINTIDIARQLVTPRTCDEDSYMYGIVTIQTGDICEEKCAKWSGGLSDGFLDFQFTDERVCTYKLVVDNPVCTDLYTNMPIVSKNCCVDQQRPC
tara:strand:+ start:182 stop:1633 length:1452 start_codon:yes stop_codon:yes gene_type:complete